jgi:hypothetical protein
MAMVGIFIYGYGHFVIMGAVYILLWAFCIVVGIYKLWWAFLKFSSGNFFWL